MFQLRGGLSWGTFRKVFGKRPFQGPWVLYEKLKTLKKNEAVCRRMLFTSNRKTYFPTKKRDTVCKEDAHPASSMLRARFVPRARHRHTGLPFSLFKALLHGWGWVLLGLSYNSGERGPNPNLSLLLP